MAKRKNEDQPTEPIGVVESRPGLTGAELISQIMALISANPGVIQPISLMIQGMSTQGELQAFGWRDTTPSKQNIATFKLIYR